MHEKEREGLTTQYRSYAKRWLVLLNVVLLNMVGAMIWLTFTPVAYKAARFYQTEVGTINWLSLVFILSGIPVGALATWVLETYGLRAAMLLSAWLGCIGSGIRIASVIEWISPDWQISLLFAGQIIAALGGPFTIYAPAKTASTWFPEHQRTLATTIGAVANPVGVVIAGLVSPVFLQEDGTLDVYYLLLTYFVPAGVTAIFTTAVMTSSDPPIAPSAGGVRKPGIFGDGIKELFQNKNYLILVWTVGGGIGLYSTFATLLEQLLCPFGYTDEMAGICSASLTAAGVVGAALIGAYVDRFKQFSTTLKVCYAVTALGTTVFCFIFHINMGYLILIHIVALGLFSFCIYPIGVELGAECTYPVGVATSSGLVMISGQLQAIILVLILHSIGRPMSATETAKFDSKCYDTMLDDDVGGFDVGHGSTNFTTGQPTFQHVTYDLSVSMYVCAAYMVLLGAILIIFFRPNYLRMDAEAGKIPKALPGRIAPSNEGGYNERQRLTSV